MAVWRWLPWLHGDGCNGCMEMVAMTAWRWLLKAFTPLPFGSTAELLFYKAMFLLS